MYTVLVGTPGTGKGNAIIPILSLLRESNTANILTDNLTLPYVLEQLSTGFPIQRAGPTGNIVFGTEASCLVVSEELSVFIKNPDYDLPNLNSLWIASEGAFSYGTRGKGMYEVTSPCQSLLGGTAPDYLGYCVPNSAVGGGFTRRVNFVYSKQTAPVKPWPTNSPAQSAAIINDLRHIGANVYGEFTFDPLARPLFEKIYSESTPADFDDEATGNYKTSLWAHVAKLAIVLSAGRDDSRVISLKNLDEAYTRVQEDVIKNIPLVFRSVGESDLASVTNRVVMLLERRGYATERQILSVNYKHVTKDDLAVVLGTLKAAGLIAERSQGGETLYFLI